MGITSVHRLWRVCLPRQIGRMGHQRIWTLTNFRHSYWNEVLAEYSSFRAFQGVMGVVRVASHILGPAGEEFGGAPGRIECGSRRLCWTVCDSSSAHRSHCVSMQCHPVWITALRW